MRLAKRVTVSPLRCCRCSSSRPDPASIAGSFAAQPPLACRSIVHFGLSNPAPSMGPRPHSAECKGLSGTNADRYMRRPLGRDLPAQSLDRSPNLQPTREASTRTRSLNWARKAKTSRAQLHSVPRASCATNSEPSDANTRSVHERSRPKFIPLQNMSTALQSRRPQPSARPIQRSNPSLPPRPPTRWWRPDQRYHDHCHRYVRKDQPLAAVWRRLRAFRIAPGCISGRLVRKRLPMNTRTPLPLVL